MTSTTEWQADASLWKDDTFFDAGTFCLPSSFPQASLEAYTVKYDLETGIHDVSLTMKGILGLSTSSTSTLSSHVAEFSNGVMKAVPRRGNGGVSSHVESTEEPIVNSDNLGAIYSPRTCPEQTNSLTVLTDLVLEDGNSRSTSSASETSSDNGANTGSKPATAGTSPTFSLPQDLLELYKRQGEASRTISALNIEEKLSSSKLWQCIPCQWLDMAISDRQYCRWEEIQEKEEPESVQEDQTVDVFPHLSSPEEVERRLRLEDLNLDAMFGQSATDLDSEDLPQEATVPDDEAVAENDIDLFSTLNHYQPDGPEFHHRNLLRYPVYQASRTPSALSLWLTMTSKRRVQIKDHVSLKAVVSSQATKWVDPVLLQEGVSVPEEVREPGNATAYRNFLTGLTTIQYEPCGTWQWDIYDHEQEIPYVMDSDTEEILEEAYIQSHEFPGLQRPCSMKEHEPLGYSFSNPQLKLRRGWESLERLGDSNLRFVLDKDGITSWYAPAATSTSYEIAEPTDLQEDENDCVEDSSVFSGEGSELEDRAGAPEADERYQEASSLRSLLAFSSLAREAMLHPNEGRFFTPRIREDSDDFDDHSDSPDGEFWETDENGAFVSPKKGKERLRGEMCEDLLSGTAPADEYSLGLSGFSLGEKPSPEAQGDVAPAFTICHYEVVDLPPTGTFRLPEPDIGTMMPTDGATEAKNALPLPVEESSVQEDILQAEPSLPYCKYNNLSEIPFRLDFAATVGQAAREFGRWFTEDMLW